MDCRTSFLAVAGRPNRRTAEDRENREEKREKATNEQSRVEGRERERVEEEVMNGRERGKSSSLSFRGCLRPAPELHSSRRFLQPTRLL